MTCLLSMRGAAARPCTPVRTRPRDAVTHKYPRRCRSDSYDATKGGRRLCPSADAVEKGNMSNA